MNLSGLSAVGPGYQQGQANIADLRLKAQQIQQGQLALDEAKRQLAAQAALFQGLPAGAMPPGNAAPPQAAGQTLQPPMPGQSSQPMAPQRQPFIGTPSSPVSGAREVGPVPPTGPAMALQGGSAPGGQMQQPGVDPAASAQDLSPQGQLSIITQIAQSIKQRAPGIDPLTLFEAVKQQIGLMGQLSATQKQQLVLATDTLKAQVSERNTDVRANTSTTVAAGHDATSRANTDKRVAAQIQTTNARIADADNRLSQTQAAINARQDKSLQGRATAKVQTERLALLRAKVAQAKQKLSAAVANGDQSAMAAADKDVADALAAVTDFQTKVVAGSGGGGSTGDQGQYVKGQIYQDAQGNKAMWDGTKFVPQ
jgi:outer membrane murein-binding lipoprotein Lpp